MWWPLILKAIHPPGSCRPVPRMWPGQLSLRAGFQPCPHPHQARLCLAVCAHSMNFLLFWQTSVKFSSAWTPFLHCYFPLMDGFSFPKLLRLWNKFNSRTKHDLWFFFYLKINKELSDKYNNVIYRNAMCIYICRNTVLYLGFVSKDFIRKSF